MRPNAAPISASSAAISDSDFGVSRFFTNPGSRASSTDIASAIVSALVAPVALVREDPAPSEECVSFDSDVALCFAIPGGRASPADFATVVAASSVVPVAPGQEDPASPADTASTDAVAALCFEIPKGRASPADFANWCNVDAGRVVLSKPRRPSINRRGCESDGLLHDALGNALPEVPLEGERQPLHHPPSFSTSAASSKTCRCIFPSLSCPTDDAATSSGECRKRQPWRRK